MNVSELARRLRTTPNELLGKLPELGFHIGARAIKIDDRMADQITRKWYEYQRKERLKAEIARQNQPVKVTGPRTEVEVPAFIAVRDLAGLLKLPVTKLIQQLMKAGILASQNERIDFTTAAIIAEELGFQAKPEQQKPFDILEEVKVEDKVKAAIRDEKKESLQPRCPVVVVMGHVDHGKTKTLDAIRRTNMVEKESGGITQHIGAYQVEKKNRKITFIDTPGHEAFTVMRSRGAKVADIAVLVVAADDGVQPQTKEAYDIIKAAGLTFVVALNKIDKPDADANRVMGQLAEIGITVEDWGGKTPMARISAKTGQGIDELLDLILLVADVEQDKIVANPDAMAAGSIIEAHVSKGEGPVATVIIQNGTLRRNDWLGVSGGNYGRVRAMRDWTGKIVDEALPGTPVKVLGFKLSPAIGDVLEAAKDAKNLSVVKPALTHQTNERFTAAKTVQTTEEQAQQSQKKMLNVVLKTDALGSLEAILGMLEKINHELVGVTVIQKGLGNITETDLERAANSQPSVVYGFNVMALSKMESVAREKNVEIKLYRVVYDLFNDIVERLNKLLPQEVIVTELGSAEVAAVFRTEPGHMIVGVKIKQGKLAAGAKMRVWRGEDPIGDGIFETLQSGKSSVKELSAGQEGGVSYKGKVKLQAGDRLDAYTEESKARKLESFR